MGSASGRALREIDLALATPAATAGDGCTRGAAAGGGTSVAMRSVNRDKAAIAGILFGGAGATARSLMKTPLCAILRTIAKGRHGAAVSRFHY